jgi:putative nucleotidyltransferase with HDIG domain
MEEQGLTRGAARALRTHIEQRRRELAIGILRAAGDIPGARPSGAATFVGTLLDRLNDELATGDLTICDTWASHAAPPDLSGGDSIIGLAFAMISASYAAEHADGHITARYLAVRGRQLDRAFEDATLRGVPVGGVDRKELVESLLASLEARDFATCDHSRAVGMWAERIAGSLSMTREEQRFIGLCGTLHDIGKLATPKAILLKPGPLDEDEWATMRDHSAVGAQILDRLPSLRHCAPVVRAHHERIDGEGYPDHLSGGSIPLGARIVAVADAFHAMISDRPYRAAVPAQRALAILDEGRDSRWDSNAVAAIRTIVVRPGARRRLDRAVGFGS